ncbi:MAG: PrsW family intramembrane metalloprotease [Lachnospiraceae bacterium]|nr:PrsW family intramembrane metalloprotease [Lachnospiraceae bacterium]
MSMEYLYFCLAAPIAVAILCLEDRGKQTMDFLFAGMTGCLLSRYLTEFFADIYAANTMVTAVEIAPAVEESLKFLPFVIYLLVFKPKKEWILGDMFALALGFATFDNVWNLVENGAAGILPILLRGLGSGAMHVVCASLISIGLLSMWDSRYLRVLGTVGLFLTSVTYHAIYNLLVMSRYPWIGHLIPLVTMISVLLIRSARTGEKTEASGPSETRTKEHA